MKNKKPQPDYFLGYRGKGQPLDLTHMKHMKQEPEHPAGIVCAPLVWFPLSESEPEYDKNCLFCAVPICEPPHVGSMSDSAWPGIEYFTHYAPLENNHTPPDNSKN